MEKVTIMRITGRGAMDVRSITDYRETETIITPVSSQQHWINKNDMEYVRGLTGYYQYELISRKMSNAEMKKALVGTAMRSALLEMERQQEILTELTKLI